MIKPNEIFHVLFFMLCLKIQCVFHVCSTSHFKASHILGTSWLQVTTYQGAQFHERCVFNVSHWGYELGCYSFSISASFYVLFRYIQIQNPHLLARLNLYQYEMLLFIASTASFFRHYLTVILPRQFSVLVGLGIFYFHLSKRPSILTCTSVNSVQFSLKSVGHFIF